jgi:ppGpp synthetase/RelA/SpoT-type nucleotidyltranferase
MSLIEKDLIKINFIVAQYADEREVVYEKITTTITEKLKRIIDDLASNFSLTSTTAIRKVKHYSFSARVKDLESLKEKMIRNNLLNDFAPLILEGFNTTDGDLIQKIKDKLLQSDDLIGIKILTDINIDCKKMFELISSSEFKSKAQAQGVFLSEEDLKRQPQQMKNGLDIFKIKGNYQKYNFELQIKSKIISAWGDMEHSIFYKDYAISPVRDTAQKSMNHVGKLLFQIDDFVESIRGANKDYSENAYALIFLQWFDSKYNQRIRDKLDNVGYRIDGIAELLYAVYRKLEVKEEISTRALRFEHFEFTATDLVLAKYVARRNKIYDLKILEGIVISWFIDETTEITEITNEEILRKYFKVLVQSASYFLCERHSGFELSDMEELMEKYFAIGFQFDCNERFFLSLNKFDDYLRASFLINDILESNYDPGIILLITQIIFINLNKGEVQNFIDKALVIPSKSLPVTKDNIKVALIHLRDQASISLVSKIDLKSITQNVIDIL